MNLGETWDSSQSPGKVMRPLHPFLHSSVARLKPVQVGNTSPSSQATHLQELNTFGILYCHTSLFNILDCLLINKFRTPSPYVSWSGLFSRHVRTRNGYACYAEWLQMGSAGIITRPWLRAESHIPWRWAQDQHAGFPPGSEHHFVQGRDPFFSRGKPLKRNRWPSSSGHKIS